MKVLKIMVSDGAIFHMPLAGFPDAERVELVDMTFPEYQAIPATSESFERCRAALGENAA